MAEKKFKKIAQAYEILTDSEYFLWASAGRSKWAKLRAGKSRTNKTSNRGKTTPCLIREENRIDRETTETRCPSPDFAKSRLSGGSKRGKRSHPPQQLRDERFSRDYCS